MEPLPRDGRRKTCADSHWIEKVMQMEIKNKALSYKTGTKPYFWLVSTFKICLLAERVCLLENKATRRPAGNASRQRSVKEQCPAFTSWASTTRVISPDAKDERSSVFPEAESSCCCSPCSTKTRSCPSSEEILYSKEGEFSEAMEKLCRSVPL